MVDDFARKFAGFQSLLSWIFLADPQGHPHLLVAESMFQSLLSWIFLADADEFEFDVCRLAEFQSLLSWIFLADPPRTR